MDEIDSKGSVVDVVASKEGSTKDEIDGFLPNVRIPIATDYDHYDISHRKIGVALIFNHKKFNDEMERRGTDRDRDRLVKALKMYGFDVRIYNDLTLKGIAEILHFVAREDHSHHDCLMVAVMSHGLKGKIHAFDIPYPVDTLWNPFLGDACPTLINKPKIFFIQACRGEKFDDGSRFQARRGRSRDHVDAGPVAANFIQTIPSTADLLVMYSTYEGSYSWRNPFYGSWFIQCLCEELESSADSTYDRELTNLIVAVARKVAFQHQSNVPTDQAMHRKKQMPTYVSTLTKTFYLRRKID